MSADAVRKHYAKVCSCEWEDHGYDEVLTQTNEACIIHGTAPDPLDALLAERDHYRNALRRIAERSPDVSMIGLQLFARQALGGTSVEVETFEGTAFPASIRVEKQPDRAFYLVKRHGFYEPFEVLSIWLDEERAKAACAALNADDEDEDDPAWGRFQVWAAPLEPQPWRGLSSERRSG
jgi:hypothetical protein